MVTEQGHGKGREGKGRLVVAAPCPAAGTWKLSCHLSVKILHVLFVGLLLFIKISLGVVRPRKHRSMNGITAVVVLLVVWSGQLVAVLVVGAATLLHLHLQVTATVQRSGTALLLVVVAAAVPMI